MPINQGRYVATERIYADLQGNLVDEDDLNRAVLVASPGSPISIQAAQKYGLVDGSGNEIERKPKRRSRAAQSDEEQVAADAEEAEETQEAGSTEAKAVAGPAENKARQSARTKRSRK